MNYALIVDGVVVNIIWLYEGNAEEFPNAVHIGERPVRMGDTWDGTDFYRNGEKVLTPLEEMELAMKEVIAEAEAAEAAYREGVQEA